MCVRGAELRGWNHQNAAEANGMHSNLVSERALADVGLLSFCSSLEIFYVRFHFITQESLEWRRMKKKEASQLPSAWHCYELSHPSIALFFDSVTRT